jgi:hypothetical protein
MRSGDNGGDENMKKAIITLGIIIALGLGVWSMQVSKQITLQWDAMPLDQKWTEVRIYDVAQSPEAIVATATCSTTCPTTVTFTVPRAAHTYVARSYDGFWESADSNVVTLNAPPKIPTGLKK